MEGKEGKEEEEKEGKEGKEGRKKTKHFPFFFFFFIFPLFCVQTVLRFIACNFFFFPPAQATRGKHGKIDIGDEEMFSLFLSTLKITESQNH